MAERQLPYNLEAEQSLIGSMLLTSTAIYAALETNVTVTDFYKPSHQHIYAAIIEVHRTGSGVDPVTVGAQLRADGLFDDIGGSAYLAELTNLIPATSNSPRYARMIQDASVLRQMILAASEIAALAYDAPPDVGRALGDAAGAIGAVLDVNNHRLLNGYYDDIATLDPGGDRDDTQPWIARGVLRRHQRLLVVARAGIGKSTLLRQLSVCCENGVHPWTGQPTETARRSLIVELEAGEWDIASSMRGLLFAMQRSRQVRSVFDLNRPALLHRPGGIDIRTPAGYAVLEAAIRRAQPELVVMGPVKYLSMSKPGENYEVAALHLMSLLNNLMDRYDFALAMEAHFSRGDHGAPGGSERWVDWPDVGFGIHPDDDDVTTRLVAGGDGAVMTVKQFRVPRDSGIWLPKVLTRGRDKYLPWSAEDADDPHRIGASTFSTRYGGVPDKAFQPYEQGEF